jgi:agmatinase
MTTFDPNAASPKDSGIFGLPYTPDESKLILIPVPWEATTSYGGGTSLGPQAILNASRQIDLFDIDLGNFFRAGISMLDESSDIIQWNHIAKQAAQEVIAADAHTAEHDIKKAQAIVNEYSEKVNRYVYEHASSWLKQNKIVGVVGGDHSVPLGTIEAHLEKYPHMGVLHIDAHADLRASFEGFEYSHASIMYNVMQKTSLHKLVQVGIRDFCEEDVKKNLILFIQTLHVLKHFLMHN